MFVEAVWRRKRPHVLPNSAFLYIITHAPGYCFCIYNYYTFWEIVLFPHFFLCTFRKLFTTGTTSWRFPELMSHNRSLDLCWQTKLCSRKTSFVCSMCLCDWTLQQGVFSEEVVDTSQPRTEERLYSPRLNLKRSFWKFARRVYLFRRRPSGQGGAGGLRLTLN